MSSLHDRAWVRFTIAVVVVLLIGELYDLGLSYLLLRGWLLSWMQASAFEIDYSGPQGTTGTIYLLSFYSLMVRLPLILLSFGAYAFFVRRNANHAGGHCPKCDYDLTGNTSGVCPECGTGIES